MKEPDYLTTFEAARKLRMRPLTIARKAKRGEIPAIKIGRQWLIRREVIEQMLAGAKG
ncbi:MAG TPA: helix-turn-helix domain-containing protein [Alphaproteobacteria bacterium]|nr:helix-turn-helix domain-containing protein [Alphaproteobacteria bacterium]